MRSSLAVAGVAEPQRLASSLSGPQAVELVVEMAHDLRSPLSSILVLAEALQNGQGGPVNEAQQRQLGLIYSAALCLCSAASDVVELARGGKRLTDQRRSPFPVSDVFDAVRAMVLPMAAEKNLELRLLSPASDLRVGCPRALSRVLLNLTTNALKYTDRGFVEIAAREAEGHPDQVEFSVRDTGPGIAPDEMRTLYEPFRARATRRGNEFSSAGLGLAICRKLVGAMGSTLRVETRAAWGTRFYFELDLPVAARDL